MKKLPVVCIYTDHDIAHNSFFDSLILSEKKKGNLRLKFKKRSVTKSSSRLFTTLVKVQKENCSKTIVFDFHDNYDFLANENLQVCDIYYKINYRDEYLSTVLSPSEKNKIKPFIPHFTVSSDLSLDIFSRVIGSWIERVNYFSLLNRKNFNIRKLLSGFARLRRYRGFVKFSDIKDLIQLKPINSRIFFIASLYEENNPTLIEVNERRINLVKLLKKEFGKHFYGGIVDTRISKNKCPELIFKEYLRHRDYLHECRKADICIYSNGPKQCLSWKLGEYIWLGKPIVSEKLFTRFDPMFQLENHLVETNQIDDLLNAVEDLRVDKERKEFISDSNLRFYGEINPLAFLHI